MFIGLLALQEFTKIRVCPGTHNVPDSEHKLEFLKELQLNKYQYFVGHPHLLHSGCSSAEYNLRLHFYHGFPPEVANSTDHIDEDDFKENFIFDRTAHLLKASAKALQANKRRRRIGLQ